MKKTRARTVDQQERKFYRAIDGGEASKERRRETSNTAKERNWRIGEKEEKKKEKRKRKGKGGEEKGLRLFPSACFFGVD